MMHYNFLILSWWTVIPNFVDSLSLLSRPTNRHVCLFHDYETVQGPYFSALFDSVFERTGYASKRMLVISTAPPVAEDHLDMMPATTRTLEKLENDLGLEACQRIFLSQYNPWSLLDKLDQFQPTILWIDNDSNAFGLRQNATLCLVLCFIPPSDLGRSPCCGRSTSHVACYCWQFGHIRYRRTKRNYRPVSVRANQKKGKTRDINSGMVHTVHTFTV